MRTRTLRSAGFTLTELMISIVIVGVLASVALPTYSRFMVNAKSSEGVQNIGLIYQGMAASGRSRSRFRAWAPTPPATALWMSPIAKRAV